MDCYYKLRQLFYYKVRHGLLQIATGITKCDDYYKCESTGSRFCDVICAQRYLTYCPLKVD